MKIRLGIPRSIFYYYYKNIWKYFFEEFNIEIVISPNTNKKIMEEGIKYATDEMCMSLKNYIGHVSYLKDKCDYILIPRVDNYGTDDQTCTNFLALYDIVNNLLDIKILNYNINLNNNETEEKGLINIVTKFGYSKEYAKNAYKKALKKEKSIKEKLIKENIKKLDSDKTKILLVGHPYNIYDNMIGKDIINYLERNDIEIIYSDLFHSDITSNLSKKLSYGLYFKYNKENIGSIPLTEDKIDGIIFLSTFPCGPDSLANELVFRKLKKTYLNLIIDDIDGMAGIETRLESFIDILERRRTFE